MNVRIFTLALLAGTSGAQAAITPQLNQSGDNTAALQRAFDEGKRTGQEVVLPAGTFSYGGQLKIDGAKVRGQGSKTVLAPQVPTEQRILMTGSGAGLRDLQINYKTVERSGSDHGRKGVMVQDAKNFNVSGVTFNGAAYGNPGEKGGGGALFVYRSDGGTISDNDLRYTAADSIHMTGGSKNINVSGNSIRGSGDDGIAVVSYGEKDRDNITISGNSVIDNRWGRGITAVGANDVRIQKNFISGNGEDGAGVYVASEPAYNAPPPKDILVEGNTIQDTGGAGKGHGQIMLWSGAGSMSDVVVRGNTVRDSERDDLAVVVSGPMGQGVVVEGNQIDGDITSRNGGGFSGSTSTDVTGLGTKTPTPSPVVGPVFPTTPSQPQENDTGGVEEAIQNMASRGYTTEQIKARFAESGVDLGSGVIDAIIAGSLGADLGIGREIMDAVTGRNVSGLKNDLINEGVIMAEDLADQYAPQLVGLMKGGACSSVVMDTVTSVGGAIIDGIFGGGRATRAAQLAQQVQLIWANKCNSEMNEKLASIEDYERKNISHGSVNGIPGINGMIGRMTGNLNRGGFLSSEEQVQDSYQRQFPNVFDPMPKDKLVNQDIIWEDTARSSRMNNLAIQNRSVQEQTLSLERARDFAAAGRAGPGIRAELQAGNAIQAEQIGAINNLTAATVASSREATVEQMRAKATKKAAHASVDHYMSNLAVCGNCAITTPFLKP